MYMALVVVSILVASALLFNTILNQQILLNRSVTASERAFYAAGTGFEAALYQASAQPESLFEGEGEVVYENEGSAAFTFKGQVFDQDDTRVPCVLSTGQYRDELRRLFTGPDGCDFR